MLRRVENIVVRASREEFLAPEDAESVLLIWLELAANEIRYMDVAPVAAGIELSAAASGAQKDLEQRWKQGRRKWLPNWGRLQSPILNPKVMDDRNLFANFAYYSIGSQAVLSSGRNLGFEAVDGGDWAEYTLAPKGLASLVSAMRLEGIPIPGSWSV